MAETYPNIIQLQPANSKLYLNLRSHLCNKNQTIRARGAFEKLHIGNKDKHRILSWGRTGRENLDQKRGRTVDRKKSVRSVKKEKHMKGRLKREKE